MKPADMKWTMDVEYVNVQPLIDFAVRQEAERREAACVEAFNAGVGVRVDCYPYRTEYWLDARVPVGEIHEHECVET